MSFSPVLSGERGTYNRADVVEFWKTRNFTWEWELDSTQVAPFPPIRLLIDGQPATPYVNSTNGRYLFSLVNIPNGHHVAQGAIAAGPIQSYSKAFVINDTGAPLPTQKPWTATTRFETMYPGNYVSGAVGASQVDRANYKPPMPKRLKPRAILKSDQLPMRHQRWVRMLSANNYAMLTRRFVTIPTGDTVIEADQKYFYNDAVSLGGAWKPGLETPRVTMMDGRSGTFGYVYDFIVRRGGKSASFMETNGRFGVVCLEDITTLPEPGADMTKHVMPGKQGEIVTLVGWRVKNGGLKAHGAIKGSNYQYRNDPTHRAYYDAQWEHVGDWSQVPGVRFFSEPWGHCVARLMPDGSIDDRDGLDGWIADTLHHRLLFVDIWPAHGAFYRKTKLAPAGYVPAEQATGVARVALFVGSTNGQPTGRLVNEPWKPAVNPRDKKIYWSNFAGNSIARANFDGSGAEIVFECAKNPTDAQLGIAQRLGWSYPTVTTAAQWASLQAQIRQQFLIDGGPGVGTCCRPQGMAFNSEGKLIIAERYTHAIRELDVETKQIRTLTTFDSHRGSTSASSNDIQLVVDVEGTCGPKDTIYISAWAFMDLWWLKDGRIPDANRDNQTWNDAHWASSGSASAQLSNGPLDQCFTPTYAWSPGLGDGKILFLGNGAGWQLQEITHRLPTDPTPDFAKWKRGHEAYRAAAVFTLTHGPLLQGALGYPNAEAMGAWDDATLRAYATQWGIPATKLDDFVYFVRWQSRDQDYTEEEDVGRIAELEAALAAANKTIAQRDAELATLNQKIANARANAQQDKDADAAHVAGQGVLDALS